MTFGGANIFGRSVSSVTSFSPRADQKNEFFGLNGLESLDGGTRGGQTVVTGVLVGPSSGDLADAEETFRGYADGLSRTLVDTAGKSFAEVKLVSFEPQGKVRQAGNGIYLRPYNARFEHLA